MNRSEAKMIAEELHKFIRNDVRKAVTEMATAETEKKIIPDGFDRLSGN